VSVTRSDRVSYNQADLDFLLRSKGIEPKEIGAVTVKPEDGKVSALITSGRLTMRELATAVQTKESERVVIRPSKDINALATQVWNHVQVRGAETPGSKEIGGDDS